MPVHAFDLDLAYTPAEVAARLDQLFARLGLRNEVQGGSEPFEWRLAYAGGTVAIRVEPLPADRMKHLAMFPRTLLSAQTSDADLEALRRHIILALFRASG